MLWKMDELKTFGKYAVDLVLLSFCFVVGKGEMEVFDGVLGVGGGSRKPKKERKKGHDLLYWEAYSGELIIDCAGLVLVASLSAHSLTHQLSNQQVWLEIAI